MNEWNVIKHWKEKEGKVESLPARNKLFAIQISYSDILRKIIYLLRIWTANTRKNSSKQIVKQLKRAKRVLNLRLNKL